MSLQPFTCGECGHQVVASTGINRTCEIYKSVHLSIPNDYLIMTCINPRYKETYDIGNDEGG